jgi:CO dehydrogenase nickel-insertion accessory protein CooC1
VLYHNSQVTLTDCDQSFVVSTADLAGMHVTRKAVQLMQQLGFPQERFQVVVNRTHREDISAADMEKLFGCPVQARLPNDDVNLHRVVTLGQPLGADGELGRAIEGFTSELAGRKKTKSKDGPRELKPAMTGA